MANVEVMKKWIAALRSGEYKQTDSVLSRKGRYCCLGVLCELAVKDGKIPPAEIVDGMAHYGEQSAYVLPPHEVREWAGVEGNWTVPTDGVELSAEALGLWDGEDRVPLSYLNDSIGLSFEEIADQIEKEYVSA